MTVANSPDYFNECAPYPFSVPDNVGGYQLAATGKGYAALIPYIDTQTYRELIGVNLTSALTIGSQYFVRMKICAGFNPFYGQVLAINKMGALFSTFNYLNNNFNVTNYCQVYTDSIIVDTVNWTTIKGSFIADSAYSFITIGNFFINANTDTIHFTQVSGRAYYYIDDVCVSADSLTCNPFSEGQSEIPNHNSVIKIFPNPFHSSFTVNCPLSTINSKLTICNSLGEIVHQQISTSTNQQIELNAAPGIYFLEAGGRVKKLVVY
jgi:hypothetical protein